MRVDEDEDDESNHGAGGLTRACLMRARSRYLTSMPRKHSLAPARTARAPTVIVVAAFVAALVGFGCVGDMGEGTTTSAPATLPTTDLPCDVETVMSTRCWACHGQTPIAGVPALTSVAAFMAPSRTDPSQSVGALAVARMQSTTSPMPPPPSTAATTAEIGVIAAWVGAGTPSGGGCGPICTSGKTWTGGNEGSPLMNPGMACNQCHGSDEGPRFSIAGTIYPTVHEPDRCDGASAASGAQVMITGADGRTLTLSPNAAGNFYSTMAVAAPYRAKVVSATGERAMTAQQTSGDCNGCHTQVGASGAPGRIMLP